MKVGMLLTVLVILSSCSSRLHTYFNQTKVTHDVYNVVTNDSLGLTMKSPGDIQFLTTPKEMQRFLSKDWELNTPENILLAGKSTVEPFYSFILLLDTPSELHHGNFSGIRIHSFQREIGGHQVNLIAHGAKANLRPDDFLFMLDNLQIQ
jgi:hypothetical protein